MFNSEEKVKEIIEHLRMFEFNKLQAQTYAIKEDELFYICRDFMILKAECDNLNKIIERLENYIRLLEKENEQLTNKHEDKGE